MPTIRSTADRLELLLPWINDERYPQSAREWREELPERLARFVASFNGSAEAGYVRATVAPSDRPPWLQEGTENIDQDEVLHTVLADILRRGFPNNKGTLDYVDGLLPIHDLRFGVERRAAPSSKRKDRQQAGAYVQVVAGERMYLVSWLVMHLLTLPGALDLRKCDAPRPYSTERCGHYFVAGGRGRPQQFCSRTCQQRKFWEPDDASRKEAAAIKRNKRRREQYRGTVKRLA